MSMLALEFEIEVWSTMKLLKLMFDNDYINIDKIKEITAFWVENQDTPYNFQSDKKNFFLELC